MVRHFHVRHLQRPQLNDVNASDAQSSVISQVIFAAIHLPHVDQTTSGAGKNTYTAQ